MEIWAEHPNLKGIQVSTYGRIKGPKGLRKTTISKIGYPVVSIRRKLYYAHRLVAETFLPNPSRKPEVNHRDRNKANNHLNNLEWVTSSENKTHTYLTGRVKSMLGKTGINHPSPKLRKIYQISLDGFLIGEFYGGQEATRNTGVAFQNIHKCIIGQRKTAGGFIWKT